MSKKNQVSRREVLRLIGAAGTTALAVSGGKSVFGFQPAVASSAAESLSALTGQTEAAGLTQPAMAALFEPMPRVNFDVSQLSCVTKPALTEGPFFVDEKLNRSDIRPDPATNTIKPGTPFKLKLYLSRVTGTNTCTPLVGAWVDLWHCDASGGYSDVNGQGNPNNLGQKFLRGYQVTDANGAVEFTTIYPGWYSGRTVHFHYKVRLFNGTTRTFDFTSQLVFDDTLTDQVYAQAPYNARPNRNTRNNNDGIAQQGGSAILLSVTADGAGGYTSVYSLGLTGLPASVPTASAVSAATFAAGALAAESIGALFGTGLATSTVAASSANLPTALGGVQLQVTDSLGVTRNAPLFFVSPTQINFQVPAGTAVGNAVINTLLNGSATTQTFVTIESVAPGLFTANATGQGVPAAVALRIKANGEQIYEPVAQLDPATNRFVAVPLDLGAATDQLYLIPFGTGLRNRSSLSAVSCTIGGTDAGVIYAGTQNQFVGVDQANILIPRSVAGRGNIDVQLSVDGKAANTVSINIR
ncbi:MAG TPA: hypothetical protein PLD20_00240 [Blastocatellia bacterium]|nr:hypothetical protein [Blastocatellia bacterium]HMX24179.1 hypothetical protein [Blastocatellia bacterium]HMY71753.1 hypothetical protein [Blastocatellia bacterium]HMZ16362.1 hypothetical protein [Blastocatellia bacterium]HNG28839.1 hypothetical protein [Blastocatellia bacterium]